MKFEILFISIILTLLSPENPHFDLILPHVLESIQLLSIKRKQSYVSERIYDVLSVLEKLLENKQKDLLQQKVEGQEIFKKIFVCYTDTLEKTPLETAFFEKKEEFFYFVLKLLILINGQQSEIDF